MIVYIDLVFLLNALCDALALYFTARLSGLVIEKKRLITASVLGGTYGVLCCLPQLSVLCSFPGILLAALGLVRYAFGRQKCFFRIFVLFFILSCTMGGGMLAISQAFVNQKVSGGFGELDWKVFFLVGSMSYFLLSVVFRGSTKHAVMGQICPAILSLGSKKVSLDVLLDTGHTLHDPYSGAPVLTVWYKAVEPLLTREEWYVLSLLDKQGSLSCAERLGTISPGKFHLIPYCAVGISSATLLAFHADMVCINKDRFAGLTIALSPTPVSDGGGYAALWGGERNGKLLYAASNETSVVPNLAAGGTNPSG